MLPVGAMVMYNLVIDSKTGRPRCDTVRLASECDGAEMDPLGSESYLLADTSGTDETDPLADPSGMDADSYLLAEGEDAAEETLDTFDIPRAMAPPTPAPKTLALNGLPKPRGSLSRRAPKPPAGPPPSSRYPPPEAKSLPPSSKSRPPSSKYPPPAPEHPLGPTRARPSTRASRLFAERSADDNMRNRMREVEEDGEYEVDEFALDAAEDDEAVMEFGEEDVQEFDEVEEEVHEFGEDD